MLDGDKVKEVIIVTGLQDDNYIEVKSGLNDGQTIVSGPYNTITNILKNDDVVKVEEKEKEDDKK